LRAAIVATLFLSACAQGTSPPATPVPPSASTATGAGPSPSGPSSTAPSSTSSPTTDPTASATTTPAVPTTSPCAVPPELAGLDLERLPLAGKQIALTFDGGSNAAGLDSIVATLTARHVPATFFLTGDFARTFPVRAATIGRSFLVGNHTETHPDLTQLSAQQVRAELREAHDEIVAATGQDPRRFFRFPFGARDARTIALVNRRCYVAFRWTVDTLGWQGTAGVGSVARVVQRVLDAASPGAIVLMHVGAHPEDGSTLDAHALPLVIRRLREQGYSFVALSAVMSEAP
jgi:peptidoglycan/xylan/chitin deacetylase (PgdA/CDA1 family)